MLRLKIRGFRSASVAITPSLMASKMVLVRRFWNRSSLAVRCKLVPTLLNSVMSRMTA